MPADNERIHLPYDDVRDYILDADVLLYRGRSLISKFIQVAGRSRYSHAALAGWTNGDDPDSPYSRLMAYEMLRFGGTGTHLRSHAEKWPGKIDVYRVSDLFTTFEWDTSLNAQRGQSRVLDRRLAVAKMKDFCRTGEYGRWHLIKAAFQHTPVIRFFFKPPTDDQIEHDGMPPFCSEAIAYALRKAFADVVANTPDRFTEPGDLARSPLLHYMFTLDAPKEGQDDA